MDTNNSGKKEKSSPNNGNGKKDESKESKYSKIEEHGFITGLSRL